MPLLAAGLHLDSYEGPCALCSICSLCRSAQHRCAKTGADWQGCTCTIGSGPVHDAASRGCLSSVSRQHSGPQLQQGCTSNPCRGPSHSAAAACCPMLLAAAHQHAKNAKASPGQLEAALCMAQRLQPACQRSGRLRCGAGPCGRLPHTPWLRPALQMRGTGSPLPASSVA